MSQPQFVLFLVTLSVTTTLILYNYCIPPSPRRISRLEGIANKTKCPPPPYMTLLKADTCTANGVRVSLWRGTNWTKILRTPYIEFSDAVKILHNTSEERYAKPPWEYTAQYMMDEAYALHSRFLGYKVEKPFVWILKNVYAELCKYTPNIYDEDGYYYRQDLGCENMNARNEPTGPTKLAPDYRKPKRAALVVQVNANAYYHFLLEGTFLRMFLLEALLEELRLPQSYFDALLLTGALMETMKDALTAFGWDANKVITINDADDGRSVFSEEAWVPTANGCCMPSCYQIRMAHYYIQKRMNLWGTLDRQKDTIVIIRREDSNKRRIINWEELFEKTKRRFPNIPVVVFEKPYTFHQTLHIFASAKLVIAPHGAGNANMLFSRPDYARLIEIHTPWENGYSLCYLRTSICFGHDYTALRYPTYNVSIRDVLDHAERAWNRISIYERDHGLV